MKNLILVVVMLIYLKTIHATCTCENTCEIDLPKLRNDTAKFFTEFGPEFSSSQEDFVTIENASNFLGTLLDLFIGMNYGADIDQVILRCILKQVYDIFMQQMEQTDNDMNHFEEELDTLLDMASQFMARQNIYSRRGTLTGCEDELNRLRCELATFFAGLRKDGPEALEDLRVIQKLRIVIEFNSKQNLTCDETAPQSSTFMADVKTTFYQIKTTYDSTSVRVNDISSFFEILTASISAWTAKVA